MKTEVLLRRASGWLLTINLTMVAAAMVIGGCASPKETSFNPEFGEDLATQPKYYIHDENDQHFLITVHQGVVSTRPERLLDVKTAATAVAKKECQRLGWDKWRMDYIQEKDQGWMHVVIVNVTRDTKTGD
jgi:hypothetical protein